MSVFWVDNLKCIDMFNPIGIDIQPFFSWELKSDINDTYQISYHIIASSSEEYINKEIYDIWDTGVIMSSEQNGIEYSGISLKTGQRVFWKVIIKDNNSRMCMSDINIFETAILNEDEWQAKWIFNPEESQYEPFDGNRTEIPLSSYIFRHEFSLKKAVKKASIYISGLGYFELRINGHKISDEVLSPGYTRYDQRTLYCAYDITGFVQNDNALAVILGNGRYNGFWKGTWDLRCEPWRSLPKLISQIHITYTDGTEDVIISDSSWKTHKGPSYFNCIYGGEYYDAQLEQTGWDMPDFDDCEWPNAIICRGTGGKLCASNFPPIKITETIFPVEIKKVNNVTSYDFGQNLSGWVKIKVKGNAGTQICIRTSEKIDDNGYADLSGITSQYPSEIFQLDKYILKGGAIEEWEPRFTYHGFRYAQIYGDSTDFKILEACSRVVRTDINEKGKFECSNDLLNKIDHMCVWSTKTNFHSIPTDCPSREKRGWTGDALMSAEQSLYNFDMNAVYSKWLTDFEDVQRPNGQLPGIIPTGWWGYNWGSGPAWDAALILIPWYVYLYTGNRRILENTYHMMLKYMDYIKTMADGYIVSFGLGDWRAPHNVPERYKTPVDLGDTTYYFNIAATVSKISGILGYCENKYKFNLLAKNIRKTIREKYMDTETGFVAGDCQTSYALAIYQGLCEDDEIEKVAQRLAESVTDIDYCYDFGLLGSKYIFNALSMTDRTEIAYKLAIRTEYPSYGYFIKHGATTLCESWDMSDSNNHHFFSEIGAWLYKSLAGINPDEKMPGFKHILLKPEFVDDITWVQAEHHSPYGIITVRYDKFKDDILFKTHIPPGSTATVHLPAGYRLKSGSLELCSGNHI
ncbi:MAG: family 78 glycoside hydrolase catalytic domain [Saccharofermentanales bacterium]